MYRLFYLYLRLLSINSTIYIILKNVKYPKSGTNVYVITKFNISSASSDLLVVIFVNQLLFLIGSLKRNLFYLN